MFNRALDLQLKKSVTYKVLVLETPPLVVAIFDILCLRDRGRARVVEVSRSSIAKVITEPAEPSPLFLGWIEIAA